MPAPTRCTALLDACVLYPLAMTDALLSLATAGLFAAKWTVRIEQEWIYALETRRPALAGKLVTRRDSMRDAIPDWEVPEKAWQAVAREIQLPDPNDVHVLAAAIAGKANCIVTSNLKDFPSTTVNAYAIDVIDPDTFICQQLDQQTAAGISAFKRMRGRRKKPLATATDFAQAIDLGGLPNTAERLRQSIGLI
jgi:predicted nucleic acid-binding protein